MGELCLGQAAAEPGLSYSKGLCAGHLVRWYIIMTNTVNARDGVSGQVSIDS